MRFDKLPHLRATIDNFLPRGRGNCIQRSVAMVMDVPTSKLVIGTLSSTHRYLHAWVEDRGCFFDPSLFEEDNGLRPYKQDEYLNSENVIEKHVIARPQILAFARRGKLSRWMLTTDDTYHALNGVMGHVLLDELNIDYVVDDRGFLFPA